MTEKEWGAQGTMPSFERLVRTDGPARSSAIRWLQLIGAAVVGGAMVGVLIHWSGAADEMFSLAAGAAGAVVVASVMWMRTGYTFTEQIRHAEGGWSALHSELARSRRHQRKFTIIGIPDDVWAAPGLDPAERMALGYGAAASVQVLLRTPDRAWLDGSLLHVLLTDCDKTQAEAFLERARTHMPHLFLRDSLGVAVFPDDGITIGALLSNIQAPEPERAAEALTT